MLGGACEWCSLLRVDVSKCLGAIKRRVGFKE